MRSGSRSDRAWPRASFWASTRFAAATSPTSGHGWRAYALALGAGTQVFTLGVATALFGTSDLSTALGLGAGWGINLAIVEYFIRAPRRASVRARTTASVTAT